MRTTLAIDDDVLTEARALARQQHRSVGEVISDLGQPADDGDRCYKDRRQPEIS